jgi:hypothetical protein
MPYKVQIFSEYDEDIPTDTWLSLAYFTQGNSDVFTTILVHETHAYLIWLVKKTEDSNTEDREPGTPQEAALYPTKYTVRSAASVVDFSIGVKTKFICVSLK